MVTHLGIVFTEIGPDYMKAVMPVDEKTCQPFGMLHGGASVALAETIGSTAATCCVDEHHICVGIEVNANHVRSVRSGMVEGTVRPVHLGNKIQVWETWIHDEEGHLVSTGRLTLSVLKKR